LHNAKIGELCAVEPPDIASPVLLEIVGFHERHAMLSPFGPVEGLGPGMRVRSTAQAHRIKVGSHLLGRLLDSFGVPVGEPLTPVDDSVDIPVRGGGIVAARRMPVSEALPTGIRALDGLLTLGRGQRVGIFAGPGCGKTTLMRAIGHHARVDVVVYALIGERGRELVEMADELGKSETGRHTVIVGATSDRSAAERVRAAYTASAIAEGFCVQGKHVLLLVDSLTRFARAVREVGMAAGEPIGRTGLPASVYAELPRLVERAGNTPAGSITGLYMVLVEGEMKEDPIAEEVRSLVEGHIVLSRSLAEKAVFPAISVLESLSRIMPQIVSEEHLSWARRVRALAAKYEDIELLLRLGEIKEGMDPSIDQAVAAHPQIIDYVRQNTDRVVDPEHGLDVLCGLADQFPDVTP
jgi:type III secretion protein N (ATPase)